MLYVVTPPLYSLKYVGRKQNLPNIYLRDEEALQCWMAEHVYMNALAVGIRSTNSPNKTQYLEDKECVKFLRSILEIGEAIQNISEELVLDPSVVERLTHVTSALDPSLGTIDVERLKNIPDVDRVTYEPNGNILILTIGQEDHIIPLQNVWKRLIDVILPLMNRIQWRKIQIYITTKNTSEFKDQQVSIMKLVALLQTLDKQFKIQRYKGLGSMKPEDKASTCMDPERRNMHRITSVGDVALIFNLLGNDPAARKKLLSRN